MGVIPQVADSTDDNNEVANRAFTGRVLREEYRWPFELEGSRMSRDFGTLVLRRTSGSGSGEGGGGSSGCSLVQVDRMGPGSVFNFVRSLVSSVGAGVVEGGAS